MASVEMTDEAHARLQDLAISRGEPEHVTAEKAIELLRRQTLLEATNAAYVALQQDPRAWNEYQAELDVWDATVADGLENT